MLNLDSDSINNISCYLYPIECYNLKLTCNYFYENIPLLSILLKKEINQKLKEILGEDFNNFKLFLCNSASVITGEFIFECLTGIVSDDQRINIIIPFSHKKKFYQRNVIDNRVDFSDIDNLMKKQILIPVEKNSYFINNQGKECINFHRRPEEISAQEIYGISQSINEIATRTFTFGNEPLRLYNLYRYNKLKQKGFNVTFESPEKILSNATNFEIIFIREESFGKYKIINGFPKYPHSFHNGTNLTIENNIFFMRECSGKMGCSPEIPCFCFCVAVSESAQRLPLKGEGEKRKNECVMGENGKCLNIHPSKCHEKCPVRFLYEGRDHFSVTYVISREDFKSDERVMTTIFVI